MTSSNKSVQGTSYRTRAVGMRQQQWRGSSWRRLLAVGLSVLVSICGMANAETITYYYTNQQGTPLVTADAAGNILSTADYRPYGVQTLGTPEAGPGYTGHVNDPGSGLVYMQARYYDPVVGRFLSADPIGLGGGSVFTFSRYGYASGNPISRTDPTGLADECGPGCKALRAVSDTLGFSSISSPPGGGAGPLGQTSAGLGETNSQLLSASAAEVRGASGYVDSIPGVSAIACAQGIQCSTGDLISAAAAFGVPEFDALEIVAVNQRFVTGGAYRSVETVLANMSYREGAVNKTAVLIRDIAGAHLFHDGNSRTAQVLAERMLAGKVTPAKIRSVVDAASDGRLQSVEEIAHALEH